MKKTPAIAAINSGSSSLKFKLFSTTDPLQELASGEIADIGSHKKTKSKSIADVADSAVGWLKQQRNDCTLTGIGHRIVHGGLQFREPVQIDGNLLEVLKKLEPFAPLHMPDAITIISVFIKTFPDILQVACFDTAFHRQMPFEARHYPIPRSFWRRGIVRFGFHGISCEYIYQHLQQAYPLLNSKKIIIAHLGSGSSLTAIKDGHSIENTMGFSPAGGMMMNTRSGDVDPNMISYCLKEKLIDANQLDDFFNKDSGLRAIAGSAVSMEQLLEKEKTNTKAAEAILMYCYHAKKQIGALAAAMGGLDILVFTGGIGGHSPVIRKRICENADFIGIHINDELNDQATENISEFGARVQVYVIPANEELILAQYANNYLRKHEPSPMML
jgi:acetate kinase